MSAPDTMPIAIRAYTETPTPKQRRAFTGNDTPSEWSLTFDCETRTDASQQLRFGVYQVRRGENLFEAGLFLDTHGLTETEIVTARAYASKHGLVCRSRLDFSEKVFLRFGFDRRATIIGFNLPFDISRLAIGHGPARGSMRGGFSFEMSRQAWWPHVRVKHLSRRAALIDFARPQGQDTARSSRKRNLKTPAHRGFFVDVATLAAALTSEGFTLARLADRLQVPTRKIGGVEHGAELTETYLDYACADVQATWECFTALRDQYQSHGLSTPLHRILSEASIGKTYLKDMGIKPLLECAPDTPRATFGKTMGTYFGGRAEVRWRREIKRVLYCDFKSMYPTVNALMGLWRFVIANGFTTRDAMEEVGTFLANATAETFKDRMSWTHLAVLVRVRPDKDLFPVRSKFEDAAMHTIGVNYLSCRSDLWVTLADCAAAKLLSGKTPAVLEAIAFEPGPIQEGLKPIDLFGNPAYRVDPATEDVFARLVDLRDEAKRRGDPLQQAMKIIANATSYGIFIEVLRDDAANPEMIAVYGPRGARRLLKTKAVEQPGRFFHPLLGVLITGAARLMLALAEQRVLEAGLDWAFCDTDSIAIVKPDDLPEPEFLARSQKVVDWFSSLNPYKAAGSILKIEDGNFALRDGGISKEIEPLYCFAISAKRYVLFNLTADGTPVIRQASAHGLGHLMAPYSEEDAPEDIPAPAIPLGEIGVDRWQYDLWFKIVEAALAGHPDQVPLNYHPALKQPALTRFGVSSPVLECWMAGWNSKRCYEERVRPFGFMVTFQARKQSHWDDASEPVDLPKRGRPRRLQEIKPIAPFDRDAATAVKRAFDRETGKPISAEKLKSYAETLAQFHLHPEDKFLNGNFLDRGRTERRHVIASGVRLIGKEANKWEEMTVALIGDDIVDFGFVPNAGAR